MYFVLYDRFLSTIGEPYLLETWSRTQRAVDFDDLKIIGQKISYAKDPFIVVVNDRQGKLLFSGLASTPSVDEHTGKTHIYLKDYGTLMNSEFVIDWSGFDNVQTVAEYLSKVISDWKTSIDIGFDGEISCDVSKIRDIPLDKDVFVKSGKESVLAWDLVSDALHYYNLFYETSLNIRKKMIIFKFGKTGEYELDIALKDFGINAIEKSFGEYNRVSIYRKNYSMLQQWALTTNNSVVKLPSDEDLVYPAKNRNFIASEDTEQSIYDAVYDAVMGLAGNRYQETVDLDVHQHRQVKDISQIDFSYSITVFAPDGYTRSLPVGEIETNSKGSKIVRLGYRVQDLTQEV